MEKSENENKGGNHNKPIQTTQTTQLTTDITNMFNHIEFGKLAVADVPYFSFNDKCFWCRIVKVYDGDSVTGIIQFEKTFYKISIRLNGIDACETRSNTNVFLKNKAVACKERLEYLIDFKNAKTNCMVWIYCYKNDKYCRVLADIYKSPDSKIKIQDILVDIWMSKYNNSKTFKGK